MALVAHEWNAPWSTPHFTMTRLAYRFPVVWVDPPRAFPLGAGPPSNGCFRKDWIRHQFEVYRPERWLPAVHRHPWLARQLAKARMARAIAILRGMGCNQFISYAWRPDFRHEFESRLFSQRCYHIDDEYTFEISDPPIPDSEMHMLRASDAVFISSQLMFEKKGRVNPRSFLSPNGVDYDLYASPRQEPADLAGIPRPRVGYTGWLKRQLDWERIEALVGRNPAWSFVFVGPTSPHPEIQPALERLEVRPNVHFLGRKTVDALAAYPQHFDVCIMPYVENGYTKYIDPLKLQEFLASGTPIVSTPLPSVKPYGDLVSFAEDVGQWESGIRAHLDGRESDQAGRAARQRMAREKDWSRMAERIADVIEGDLVGVPHEAHES